MTGPSEEYLQRPGIEVDSFRKLHADYDPKTATFRLLVTEDDPEPEVILSIPAEQLRSEPLGTIQRIMLTTTEFIVTAHREFINPTQKGE